MQKQKKEYVILGVDPGTRVTGYGLIKTCGQISKPLDFGCIRPPIKQELNQRYLFLFNGIEELIERYSPDFLSVETQFFSKNAQSALKLGMARGVIILAATKRGIPVNEYAPKKAKIAAVGTGSASKNQVQKMIQLLLNLKELPTPEDAADALALALCHAHHMKLSNRGI